jgi:hypothetical protein
VQDGRGLVDAEAAEEAQLDHPGLARCPLREPAQGIVQGHEVIGAIGAHDGFGVERDMLGIRAALHVTPPDCRIICGLRPFFG